MFFLIPISIETNNASVIKLFFEKNNFSIKPHVRIILLLAPWLTAYGLYSLLSLKGSFFYLFLGMGYLAIHFYLSYYSTKIKLVFIPYWIWGTFYFFLAVGSIIFPNTIPIS